jgi:hypothetical protein
VVPQPLTEQLLARTPELAGEVGQQLLQLFKDKGVTDAAGMLLADPRQANWHAVLQESEIAGETAHMAVALHCCCHQNVDSAVNRYSTGGVWCHMPVAPHPVAHPVIPSTTAQLH